MLVASIISISLVSYLNLSRTTLEVAHRSFLVNSSVNLAELGLEQALYCLNRNQSGGVALATAWDGWTTDSTAHTATRTFPDSGSYQPAPNATATVRVFVANYDLQAGAPTVVSKATIQPGGNAPPMSRYLQVTLARRALWSYGLVGRTRVQLNSNARVDSWDSGSDDSPTTPVTAYAAGVRRDNGSVGTVSAVNGAVGLNSNAEVYGQVNTGGGTVTTLSNARIYGATTPARTNVDASRVNNQFEFTFPPITVPSPPTINTIGGSITGNSTLPNPAIHSPNPADGKYYFSFGIGTNIDLASNKTLRITDSVVLLFNNHAGVPTIHTDSNANIAVTPGKSVEVYTQGDITMDSNNSINIGNEARHFLIYGTSTTTQRITLSSNVVIYGCIYAPNAAFQIDSNCRLYGAIIADTIQMDSNAEFHYDEALGNFGGRGGFRVNQWKELRDAAERTGSPAGANF